MQPSNHSSQNDLLSLSGTPLITVTLKSPNCRYYYRVYNSRGSFTAVEISIHPFHTPFYTSHTFIPPLSSLPTVRSFVLMNTRVNDPGDLMDYKSPTFEVIPLLSSLLKRNWSPASKLTPGNFAEHAFPRVHFVDDHSLLGYLLK